MLVEHISQSDDRYNIYFQKCVSSYTGRFHHADNQFLVRSHHYYFFFLEKTELSHSSPVDNLTLPLQPLGSDAVKTSRVVVEGLIPQIGRAGIAEDNVRRKAAAGVTATVSSATVRAAAVDVSRIPIRR